MFKPFRELLNMKIQEFADLTGLSTKTIRYYGMWTFLYSRKQNQ
jgi:DNA-binding transcriptional regulator YiaG